jgi:hypothetical protein
MQRQGTRSIDLAVRRGDDARGAGHPGAHRHQLGLTGPKDQAAEGAQLIRDRPPGGDGKQVHHPIGLANDPTAGQNYTAQQAGSEEAG